ncbi:DUF885 domain-containing protein [Amycolatopsis suaedae]|uniref:DUF885 domain-containing protein n=1 Tax=Amycolatopsis suaedae TaxID=2510978 RepID=A0A4Q7JEM1_9PSEU|nr:DUF885 domain-containing protein [Amycolatopsis suaedae]RZQ65969.1 DUF885 domain-containing protein [Amycolatopsis suaedae]
MTTVTALADEYWTSLRQHDPYYAVLAGEAPGSIEPAGESFAVVRSAEASGLLGRLRATVVAPGEEDLAAVLESLLLRDAAWAEQLWHVHPAAPYQAMGLVTTAQQVIAPQPDRERLTREFAELIRSIAALVAQQRARGIVLPRPAVAGARATWTGLRTQLPELLRDDDLRYACEEVLGEIDASAAEAGDKVGLANLPGGEQVYRALVRQETTLDVEPEELHRLGLEECASLSERMAEIRSRLGGPAGEEEARDWIRAQPHLYADSPDAVAATYRRHIARIEPRIGSLFRVLPRAGHDVRRADPSVEAGMTFGYYQPPTSSEPGLYRFNGSGLGTRSQLTAAALILHELIPGHHFHLARQNENAALHPLQRYALGLGAFNEGWGEYASGLGWELGAYADDWDAYGRLSHERFTAQRLVVDTALNLGWWDLDRAREFMRANTLEDDGQIATEVVRYSTDLPAQALAYRAGYLAFQRMRESAREADVRDVHEAMIGPGAAPLDRVRQRVDEIAQ